jgi:phosphohistidine swiveling domain-containing protein/DNA-directed RNA polymerase subunit M/transcription elongation factor TFIIS
MLHEALDDFPQFRDPDGGVWVWDSESHSYTKKPSAGLEQDRGHATGGDNDLFNQSQIEHSELAGVPELEGYMAHVYDENCPQCGSSLYGVPTKGDWFHCNSCGHEPDGHIDDVDASAWPNALPEHFAVEWAPPGKVLCPQCREATNEVTCPQCGKDLTPEWNNESDKNNEFMGVHPPHDNTTEHHTFPDRVPKRNREKTDDSYPSMSLSKTYAMAQKLANRQVLSQDEWDDFFAQGGSKVEIGKWLLDRQGQFHFDHGMHALHENIAARDGLQYPADVAALGSVYNDGSADTQKVNDPARFNVESVQSQITQAFGPVTLQPPVSTQGNPQTKGVGFQPVEITGGSWLVAPNAQNTPITGTAWVKGVSQTPYNPRMILVAEHLQPDDYELYSQGCAAIITATGGMSSHAAYLASTEGIPTIVGIGAPYNKIENGNYLKIDPSSQTITVMPGADSSMSPEQKQQVSDSYVQYQLQHGGSLTPTFAHVDEEAAWKLAHPATLEACPECNDVMVDGGDKVSCHSCGHTQPVIRTQAAVLAPLGEAAIGGLAELGGGAAAGGAAAGGAAAGGAAGGGGMSGIGSLMNKAMSGNPLQTTYYADKLMGGGDAGGAGGAPGGGETLNDPAEMQGVVSKAQMQHEAGIWGTIIEHIVNALGKAPEALVDPKNPLSYADDVAGLAAGAGSGAQQQFQSSVEVHAGERWDHFTDRAKDFGKGTLQMADAMGGGAAAIRDEFRDTVGLWPDCPQCGEKIKPYGDHSGYEQCKNCGYEPRQIDRPTHALGDDGNYVRGDQYHEYNFDPEHGREQMNGPRQGKVGFFESLAGTFGEEEVGNATKNRGENSDPEHDGSGASFKEKGDSPELLKDIDGPGDAKNDAFPEDDLGNQGDPAMQEKALKSLHMNLPLVIEFSKSDEAGANNPILQALDAMLEEAFPGYKGGTDPEGEQKEHPLDEDSKSEDESGDKPDDGDSSNGDEKKPEPKEASIWNFIAANDHPANCTCPECEEFEATAPESEWLKATDEKSKTAARSDYDHHNEEGDRMWWEEEGKHQGDPNEGYLDPHDYDDQYGAEDAQYEDMYEQMQGMEPEDLQAVISAPQNFFEGDPKQIAELAQEALSNHQYHQERLQDTGPTGLGGLEQPIAKTAGQVGGMPPMGAPAAMVPQMPAAAPVCPMCGQTHAPGTACPAPAAANVTAPAATGQPITPPQPNTVVTKWHVVALGEELPAEAVAPAAQAAPTPEQAQAPDVSPGDVIAAYPDGTIVLDDGITTFNPARAKQFLEQQGQGNVTALDPMQQGQFGPNDGHSMQAAVDGEFAFYGAADEPHQEHETEHKPQDDSDSISDDGDPSDIDSSSDTPWVDDSGAPITEGMDYEMKANSYAIPDRVTVDRVLPDKIQYTLHGGDVDYQDSVTKEQLDLDGISFTPVGGDTPYDSEDGFQDFNAQPEAPVRPGQDATPQVDDLSTPSTVVSSTEFEPISLDNYTGSFQGDSPDDRSWLNDDSSPVAVDPELMAKFAAKDFSPREQREFIDETGEARNLDRLDLEGTHYVTNDVDAHFNW